MAANSTTLPKFDELIAPTIGPRFHQLREAQREALRLYSDGGQHLGDIAIELPTGAGKTLIALLILEWHRRQGRRVAMLSGNKVVARQTAKDADDLRVPVVRMEGDRIPPKELRAYSRGQAIGLMNYWVYINQNPKVEPADYLVLDDAQLADGALSSLFTLNISRYSHAGLFDDSMKLFSQYSDSPVADDYVKGLAETPWGATDLLSFIDFDRLHDEFEALVDEHISRHGQEDAWTDLRFRWNRLRPSLRQALVLVSNYEIVIRPYIYPSRANQHLTEPKQRIYMSATLHDLEDLRRRLGTFSIKKLPIPENVAREQEGRRLLVFNQTSSGRGDPSPEVLVPLMELIVTARKSVWLCTSRREADAWSRGLDKQLSSRGLSHP